MSAYIQVATSKRDAQLLVQAFANSVIRAEFAMENRSKMPRERLESIKAEREDFRERLIRALGMTDGA